MASLCLKSKHFSKFDDNRCSLKCEPKVDKFLYITQDLCADCLSKNKVKVEIYPKIALLIKAEIIGSMYVPFLCFEFLQMSKVILFLNLTKIKQDT